MARNTEKCLNKRSASTGTQVVEGCQNTVVKVAQHWNFGHNVQINVQSVSRDLRLFKFSIMW